MHQCSNVVANVLPSDPPRPFPQNPRDGVNFSKFIFSEHGHVAYQINGITKCSSMVANALPTDPSPMPLTRSIDQKSTFSERDNVAYQIKGNHECSNMVANTLPAENNNVKRNLLVVNLRFNEKKCCDFDNEV